MTKIAVEIKCEGDKCGNCRFRSFGAYVFKPYFGTANFSCTLYRQNFEYKKDDRLPECLAAELKEKE